MRDANNGSRQGSQHAYSRLLTWLLPGAGRSRCERNRFSGIDGNGCLGKAPANQRLFCSACIAAHEGRRVTSAGLLVPCRSVHRLGGGGMGVREEEAQHLARWHRALADRCRSRRRCRPTRHGRRHGSTHCSSTVCPCGIGMGRAAVAPSAGYLALLRRRRGLQAVGRGAACLGDDLIAVARIDCPVLVAVEHDRRHHPLLSRRRYPAGCGMGGSPALHGGESGRHVARQRQRPGRNARRPRHRGQDRSLPMMAAAAPPAESPAT